MIPKYKTLIIAFAVLVVWETIWKGFALWRAGRNRQPIWYTAMLITHTLGLLEIIFLLLNPLREEARRTKKEN